MRGLRQSFFAGLAATLRAFAWLPLGLAKGAEWLADRCEDLAV